MGLIVPNPTVPTDGQPVEATTLAANLNAVYQAIQSFDASQIATGTLLASAFSASINPNTILHDTFSPFVQSGCIWTGVGGLIGTMTAGIIYASSSTAVFRVSVTGIGSHTFAASSDTYVDIDYLGNVVYAAVANLAAAPAITANSLRIAVVITNGSAITSVRSYSVQSWLPSWTNFTPGNSVITATYQQIGNMVDFDLSVILGSTASVGGTITFTLPVTSISTYNQTIHPLGIAGMAVSSGGTVYRGFCDWNSTTTAVLSTSTISTYPTFIGTGATVPFTWTSGSIFECQGRYQAA